MMIYKEQLRNLLTISLLKVGSIVTDVTVEPNKMLPTYGSQKLNLIKNFVCQKGRYFVSTVCYTYILIFLVC